MKTTHNKPTARQIADTNILGYGSEPSFDGSPVSNVELVRLYTWYGALKDYEDAEKYLVTHFKDSPETIKAIQNTSLTKTYGWIARMISRGAVFDKHVIDKFDAYIALVKLNYQGRPADIKPAIEPRSTDKIANFLPTMEESLDNLDISFDAYKYLSDNQISQAYVVRIKAYYQRILEEVEGAIAKSDVQLVQAYSVYRPAELRKYRDFVNKYVEDCDSFLGNIKKNRKPKKIKPKSTTQILKYFKYCVKDDTLQLVSIDPMLIIGAQQLFTFNTANKQLTVFNAKDEKGLTISRSSIEGFNEETSISKKVGKRLKTVIPVIQTGSKKARGSVMDLLTTESSQASSRINTNVLLLKVYKK